MCRYALPDSDLSPTAATTTKSDVLACAALQISGRRQRKSLAGMDLSGLAKPGLWGSYTDRAPYPKAP